MAVTRYFAEQVVRKRPYLSESFCRIAIAEALRHVEQPDGRHRYWGPVRLPGDEKQRILRVVTLKDGVTIHNAFLDRDFRQE